MQPTADDLVTYQRRALSWVLIALMVFATIALGSLSKADHGGHEHPTISTR